MRRFIALDGNRLCDNMFGVPSLSPAHGEVFEMLAHEMLVKGGTFTIWKLEDGNQISSIQLDKRDKVEIRKVEEI